MLLVELLTLLCGHHADQVLWNRSTNMSTVEHKQPTDVPGGDRTWMLEGPKNLLVIRKAVRNGEYCKCHQDQDTNEKELPQPVGIARLDSEDPQ